LSKDARKAERKVDRASHEIADKTKDAAEKVKDEAKDLGHGIKKKLG
jgi:hypothetical protein